VTRRAAAILKPLLALAIASTLGMATCRVPTPIDPIDTYCVVSAEVAFYEYEEDEALGRLLLDNLTTNLEGERVSVTPVEALLPEYAGFVGEYCNG